MEVISVIGFNNNIWVRHCWVNINWHVEGFCTGKNRPVFFLINKVTICQPVYHASKTKILNCSFQFVGSCLRAGDGTNRKAGNRSGCRWQVSCNRSLAAIASLVAFSASNLCTPGAPCDSTCMSIPDASISLIRVSYRSSILLRMGVPSKLVFLSNSATISIEIVLFDRYDPISTVARHFISSGILRFTAGLYPPRHPMSADTRKWQNCS